MIPFYRPFYNHLELLAALRPGPARREFELAMAARVGGRYALTFAYGRAGLVAAFKALGLTQAEVVLPAYTCLVMAHAVMASGNRPAFVDIDLADYNMDISALKRALTPQTRAVVATHMYGYPTDVDAIRATIGDERIIIVEDAAMDLHTLSSEGKGLRGDLGLFSLGPNKPISTFEGGVLVTNSPEFYEKIKAYRDREMKQISFKAQAKRWTRLLTSYFVFNRWIYSLRYRYRTKLTRDGRPEYTLPPNYMPGDIAMAYPNFQAHVGMIQLRKVNLILAKRRALAKLYNRELQDLPGICPAPLVDNATYAYYTLRVPKRDQICFRQRMVSRSITVDQVYDYALPYTNPFRPFARGTYSGAAQAASEVLNLPCYPNLGEVQAKHIAASVRDCVYEINR